MSNRIPVDLTTQHLKTTVILIRALTDIIAERGGSEVEVNAEFRRRFDQAMRDYENVK